jgi:ABC-2 type transport system ATP-binding protein
MHRRPNIGIGLLHQPQLLILDEPTVGVDPQSRNSILATVERLGSEGMAVLYTTHYMEEAERLWDRVGIIDKGHVIAEGTQSKLVTMVGGLGRVHMTASGELEAVATSIGAIPGVENVTTSDHAIGVMCKSAPALLPEILSHATVAAEGRRHSRKRNIQWSSPRCGRRATATVS